jgi:hypothetical protein
MRTYCAHSAESTVHTWQASIGWATFFVHHRKRLPS